MVETKSIIRYNFSIIQSGKNGRFFHAIIIRFGAGTAKV